jgi:broad specificity phosphatase PhoE
MTTSGENPKTLDHQESSGFHRRRTLYLVRHGEAVHNVLEAKAQEEARLECQKLGLGDDDEELIRERMETARQEVLKDASLRDAPLTEKGRRQAAECGTRLQKLVDEGVLPPPSEAMVSPLTRTLDTCDIILDRVALVNDIKAHIREELQERQTRYPPDMARSRRSIFRYAQSNDRFLMTSDQTISESDIAEETMVRESKEMLRERASRLFDLLLEMEHLHVLIVSHKGYLRELERGLLGLTDSPLFQNAELRVYQVVFTRGGRKLESIQRLA